MCFQHVTAEGLEKRCLNRTGNEAPIRLLAPAFFPAENFFPVESLFLPGDVSLPRGILRGGPTSK